MRKKASSGVSWRCSSLLISGVGSGSVGWRCSSLLISGAGSVLGGWMERSTSPLAKYSVGSRFSEALSVELRDGVSGGVGNVLTPRKNPTPLVGLNSAASANPSYLLRRVGFPGLCFSSPFTVLAIGPNGA